MRFMKLLGLAFLAALACSAVAAANSPADEVLFLTASGKQLLFTGISLLALLRGLRAGVLSTISCELDLIHGLALHKSPLAHRITLEFHTKCQTTIGSTTEKCTEPLVLKELLGELGLILPAGLTGPKLVGLLLAPSSGTALVKFTCGSFGETEVEGAVIGEIPSAQVGMPLEKFLLKFESENKNENQKYTVIDLLGVEMSGVSLKVSGFLGGSISEEDEVHLTFDGAVEICVHA
jgi:hypothetical protein